MEDKKNMEKKEGYINVSEILKAVLSKKKIQKLQEFLKIVAKD